ncbi:HNH endonuclease [Caballeronia sp. AZ10_KS36]|uniref:HNH endonuclease n=1 Tax=Caballeronia sp. AZ10_KS36 TaxID=2921757 RepID=UPI0020286343|nr:HNH endonuclease [Caballeronia sp. AZ10_KS36]
MSKYSALSEHLARLEGSYVSLTFEEIERVIDAPLPASARKFDAWWENEKSGTHKWAHLWRAAGWRRDTVNLKAQVVTFRRSDEAVDDLLGALRPRTKEAIYDLLQLVDISTDDWHTTDTGHEIDRVKANPSYCYDWSFGSPREGYALCIWHETLDVSGGRIVFTENLRIHAEKLRREANDSAGNSERRNRTRTQAARAQAFDDALSISYERMLPVSVILTEGDRLVREAMGDGSSHVQYRALDAAKWFVHDYNSATGAAILVRGQKPLTSSAPANGPDEDQTGEPDKIQLRAIAIRQGQSGFREKLLSAYGRTCAVTGCRVVDLLEAAHIRPHAEEPNYNVTNGLLLRADIHTLFDLGLLAIDTRLRVRIVPALLRSEYKAYEGREIRHPAYPSEMPNSDALQRRYKQFEVKGRESGSL